MEAIDKLEKNDEKGFFVAFEGLDGAGKSTQARLLAKGLREEGYPVMEVAEPGGTKLGEKIRDVLLRPQGLDIAPMAELFLYEASRAQLVRTRIKPALAEGKIVIADRFALSSVAYQGYGRRLGKEKVVRLNEYALGGTRPDLTVLLDINLQERIARKGKEAKDRIEKEGEEFFERVRGGFKQGVNRKEEVLILEGSDPREKLQEEILHKTLTMIEGEGSS